MNKIVSRKYSQKLLDHARQYATNAFETASKIEIQKTANSAGNLIGIRITDESTEVSKRVESEAKNIGFNIEIPKEGYIPPEKRLLMM